MFFGSLLIKALLSDVTEREQSIVPFSPLLLPFYSPFTPKIIMKKAILTLSAVILATLGTQAQQALFGGSSIVSPEIHPDNTVTFRLYAPKAVSVKVTRTP